MAHHGRVDLDRMHQAYRRERAALAHATAPERWRVVRAQASIDRNTHMVGRVGRFQAGARTVATRRSRATRAGVRRQRDAA